MKTLGGSCGWVGIRHALDIIGSCVISFKSRKATTLQCPDSPSDNLLVLFVAKVVPLLFFGAVDTATALPLVPFVGTPLSAANGWRGACISCSALIASK